MGTLERWLFNLGRFVSISILLLCVLAYSGMGTFVLLVACLALLFYLR